jgi:hypothetical protein
VLRVIGAGERYWTDEHESELFGLLVMQAIFLPCQGFFNVIVFSRPKYRRIRKSFPDQSPIGAFRMALFEGAEKLPLKKREVSVPRKEGATTSKAMASQEEFNSLPLSQGNEAEREYIIVDTDDEQKCATDAPESTVASSPAEDIVTRKVSPSASMNPPAFGRSKTTEALMRLSKRFTSIRHDLRDIEKTTENNGRRKFSASVGGRPQRAIRRSEIDSFLFGSEHFSEFHHPSEIDKADDEIIQTEGTELRAEEEGAGASGNSHTC